MKSRNWYIKAAWIIWLVAGSWIALDLFAGACDVYAFDDSGAGLANWSAQGLLCSYSTPDGLLVVTASAGVNIYAVALLGMSLPPFALGVRRVTAAESTIAAEEAE